MRKIVDLFFVPIMVLLAFLGCSVDNNPIAEEKNDAAEEGVPTDLSDKLILNRPYTDGSYGYVLINTSSSLSSQMSQTNTIYEIEDKIDLDGKTLSVPANSVLRFNGGSITNGTVTFDNTYIEGLVKFKGVTFKGTLINKEVVLSWFGADPSNTDNSTIINQVLNIIPETLVVDALYPINKAIVITHGVTLRGIDWTESVYANFFGNAEYGFQTSSNISAVKFSEDGKGSLNMFGISLLGNKNLYGGGNPQEGLETIGIFMKTGAGSLTAVVDCSIAGFTYGIKAIGGYIEKIRSTYFSLCRFGIFTAYTSDFICQDCHFNSNMHNYNWISRGVSDTDPNAIRNVGGGVKIKRVGMAQFINCRFEFNFIHFIIDEASTIINVENSIFDAAVHSCIMLFNENNGNNMIAASEMYTPSINCVNISGNTFSRGARLERYQNTPLPGSAIVYVREGNNRGLNFNFSNNVVVDSIEVNQPVSYYEKTIFRIYNTSNNMGVINSNANDFSHCKAETVAAAVTGSSGRFTIKDNGSNFGNISHQFPNNSIIDIKKMEVAPDGKIIIWNTLTNGNTKSQDLIIDPNQ